MNIITSLSVVSIEKFQNHVVQFHIAMDQNQVTDDNVLPVNVTY